MMMDIATDHMGSVYVRWDDGGPWAVLHRDGTVTCHTGLGGATEWEPVEAVVDCCGWDGDDVPGPAPRPTPGLRTVELPVAAS